MANNKISEDLKKLASYLSDNEDIDIHPEWPEDLVDYAAKLDRLVEATKEMVLAFDSEVHYSAAPLTCEKLENLTAALRDIELPKEPK